MLRSLRAPLRVLLALWLVPSIVLACTDVPTSGKSNRRYAAFDAVMQQYVQEHDMSAATLAIRVDGELVYERGYGWSDKERREPVKPTAKFRIASLTKPITAAAITRLVEEDKFQLGSKAFDLLKLKPPAGRERDPRLASITVDQLLHHKGGWDKGTAGDPTWNVAPISEALGLDRPPTAEEIVSWMMGQPLDFEPGARPAYSNLGYMILGLIVREHAKDYYKFTRTEVLEPLKIRDAVPARSLLKDCDPLEVFYLDEGLVKPVVPGAGETEVSMPYGGFRLEERYAVGGWAMSAGSYARFMEAFGVYGETYERGKTWKHTGAQPGVSTIALWRPDGTKIVAFFNRNVSASLIEERLLEALDKVGAPGKPGDKGPK